MLDLWRILRVGLVYLTFGVAVALLTQVWIPIVRRLGSAGEAADLMTQRWLHRAARVVVGVAVGLRVIELSLHRTELLAQPGPLLVLANHPTTLDATLLAALMPQIDMVVEASWAETPIVGRAVSMAGYLRNDSGRTVVEDGERRLRGGRRLLIFPEGSRSPVGGLHPFRRGAARIALASGCAPIPVVIRCDPPIGLKGKAWYDIPRQIAKMSITVGEAISIGDLVDAGDSRGVAARKINRTLREYFLRELNYADV